MSTDDIIEKEQEALAGFDKIKESFIESSPNQASSAGKGLGDGYADETIMAEEAARRAYEMDEEYTEPSQEEPSTYSVTLSPEMFAGAAAAIAAASGTEAPAPAPEAAPAQTPAAPSYESSAASESDAALGFAAAAVASGFNFPEAPETAAAYEESASADSSPEEASAAESAPKAPVSAAERIKVIPQRAKGISAAVAGRLRSKKKPAAAEKEETPVKEKKKKKRIWLRILLGILIFIIVAGIAAAGVCGYYVYKVISNAPDINPNNIYELLSENSTIYDVDGNVISNIYKDSEGLRKSVDYSELPENLKNAFIAIEDKTFYDHNGFNVVRIFGAIWNSAKSGFKIKIQGTSTITQQLARNIFLTDERLERSFERKIREAYYTILIEQALSKEQIIEAYLNTVNLGFNSNGVGAAAEAYFNKEVSELTLVECATLAALPQSPSNYSPMKRMSTANAQGKDLDIITQDEDWTIYYNNSGESRVRLVLKMMHDQGLIDDAAYDVAKEETPRGYLNPGNNIDVITETTYMSDFVVSQVVADLQKELGMTYSEAREYLATGGLQIYSTIDMTIQGILDEVYADPANFPQIKLSKLKTDKDKNILNDDKTRIMLYNKEKLFDEDGNLNIAKGEFQWNDDGSLTIFRTGRFNIYNTKVESGTDIAVYIKPMYYFDGDQMYSISECYLNIASRYKTRDANNDLIISAQYMKDYPYAFLPQDDGSLKYAESQIVMKTPIMQPQSAMTIIESGTGYLRAMIGGRGISGSLLYNRATATRQPGSSIKPLAIYSTALQVGYNNSRNPESDGPIFTAGYAIDDIPQTLNGALWPKNVYTGYTGITYLRDAVVRSVNACAVNLYSQLTPEQCAENVQKFGITSLVLEGSVNDLNASALALGGMAKGISPYEMASAYSTFGNYGTHIETTCYTKIVNKRGEVILEKVPETTQVVDAPVASIMVDILESATEYGGAKSAKLKSQPSAGKTGTTSDQYDIWFCGLTPKYSASAWIGCDTNVSLGTGSSGAASLWAAVMEKVGALDPKGKFEMKGSFVTVSIDKKTGLRPSELTPEEDIIKEIFISGTEPKKTESSRIKIVVCGTTGYLATSLCPTTGYKSAVQRPGGLSWESMLVGFNLKPKASTWNSATIKKNLELCQDRQYDVTEYYCPIHNPNTKEYKVSPLWYSGQEYNTEDIDPIEPEIPDDPVGPVNPDNGNTGGGNGINGGLWNW